MTLSINLFVPAKATEANHDLSDAKLMLVVDVFATGARVQINCIHNNELKLICETSLEEFLKATSCIYEATKHTLREIQASKPVKEVGEENA